MLLAPEVGEVTIPFSRLALLKPVAILAAFVALSVAVHPDQWSHLSARDSAIWCGIAILIVLGFAFLPGRYYLHLSADGLRIQYVGRHRLYTWDEIDQVALKLPPGPGKLFGSMVVLLLTEDSPHHTAAQRAIAAVNGYDVSIMCTYAIGARELAETIVAWSNYYAARQTPATAPPIPPLG